MRSLSTLVATASIATAQIVNRDYQCSDPSSAACIKQKNDYIQSVCAPTNASGSPNLDAPCNVINAISYQCIFGAAGLKAVMAGNQGSFHTPPSSHPAFSNVSQQACVCQSQFFDQAEGCAACRKAHGATDWVSGYFPPELIQDFSSSYCAIATNAPSIGFALASFSAFASWAANQTQSQTPFSDPIGSSTAVSLYYTPKITGSAAWVLAEGVETVGEDASTDTASTGMIAVSDSRIVATTPSEVPASATATTASKTSSGTGGHQTAAFAGIVALAGIVAFL